MPTGIAIAQRVTSALTLNGVPYQRLADIVYFEMLAIGKEQKNGDWLVLPDGSTYVKEYTTRTRRVNETNELLGLGTV